MPAAPLPEREAERLAALRASELLDTSPQEAFDDLARVAAQLFEAPIALVSLVDASRQWFKARVGLDVCETPREQAFCAWAICEPQRVLTVEDAPADPRFADNALVTGGPGIRFYAGAPILDGDGHALGTLCVIDTRPRSFPGERYAALAALARQAGALLKERAVIRELTSVTRRLLEAESELHARNEHLAVIERMGAIVLGQRNADETVERVLELCRAHFGAEEARLVSFEPDPGGAGGVRCRVRCGADGAGPVPRSLWDSRPAAGPAGSMRSQADGLHTWFAMDFAGEGGTDGAVLLRFAPGRALSEVETEVLRSFSVRLGIFLERAEADRARARDAARLAESEQRFRSLTDDSPVMMWMGGADGGCVHVNRSWIEFTGRPFETHMGRGWLAGVHAEDLERLETTFRRAFEALAPFACEFRLPRADGELRWLLTAGRPRIDETGEFLGYMGSCLDITERVLGERAARTSRDQALEAARSQGRFLSALGRELRAPLQGLIGALDLTEGCASEVERQELLGLARSASDRLLERLDMVSELSRLETEPMRRLHEPYDPRALCEELVAELGARARARGSELSLEFEARAGGPRLGDAGGLRRALRALLERELVGAAGARLTLRVESRDGEGLDWSLVDSAHTHTDPEPDAAPGLELALARRLLLRMDSELVMGGAGGTRFAFALADERADEPEPALPAPVALGAGYSDGLGLRALVVVGDELGREVLARMLRSRRFEVEALGDGLAALARRRAGAAFDVVLVDADTGCEGGAELVRRLRAVERERGDRRTPILGLSSEEGMRSRWYDADADDCLHKPVGMAALEAALGEWVGGLGAMFGLDAPLG